MSREDYTDLITSEHQGAPNFISTVNLLANGLGATTDLIDSMPAAFDLNSAIGAQLDVVGQWVGQSRNVGGILNVPYFGFADDLAAQPFGEITNPSIGARFFDIGDPITSSSALADPEYRLLLLAKILRNQYDGSLTELEEAVVDIVGNLGSIIDPGNLIVSLVTSSPASPVIEQLLTGFDLLPRPAGVLYVYLFALATWTWGLSGAAQAVMVQQPTPIPPWSLNNNTDVGITFGATTAPDGTNTAAFLYENSTNTNYRDVQTIWFANSAPAYYTLSCYFKAAQRNEAVLQLYDGGVDNLYCFFNIATGTVLSVNATGGVTNASATITAVGNGWYRATITALFPAATWGAYVMEAVGASNDFPGIVGNGIYFWGPQVDAGTAPTAYAYPEPLVLKNGGVQQWDSMAYMVGSFAKVSLQWKIRALNTFSGSLNAGYMGGLSSSPTSDPTQTYVALNYAIGLWNGTLYIYESGVQIGTFGTYVDGDAVRVHCDGTNVVYRHNGTIMRTTPAVGGPFSPAFALGQPGCQITNINIATG